MGHLFRESESTAVIRHSKYSWGEMRIDEAPFIRPGKL